MSRASIPVNLFSPGQVFASLGFLEAADVLCSDASGGFDWTDESDVHFILEANRNRNPFEVVLEFLANAELRRVAPFGYEDPPFKNKKAEDDDGQGAQIDIDRTLCFTAPKPDRMSLPIRLTHAGQSLDVSHWADGSSRKNFKLYAGNRSAASIALAMLTGTQEKPRKGQNTGPLKTKGIRTLWEQQRADLISNPFDLLTPIGGSFNFDPRGAWTALDTGYSPNDQKHAVVASPVVEMLAAIGLEYARPENSEKRRVEYAVWRELVTPSLARPLLAGARFGVALRKFAFTLGASGKNSIVTFAEEETI